MNINDIKLNPNNPRYIKDDRYQKLKKNMQEFPKMMKLRPIVVDDDGMILGGNMRYLAIKDLKYTEIPEGWVVKASELTEDERRRFTITDNIPYGDWDYDKLANEWDMTELQDWGIELPEIEIKTEEDEFNVDKAVEEVKEPICKTGDIWQLGNHRLMCGDSTKREDVEKLMDGKKADMVFTDPPYGIDYQSNMRTKSNKFEILKNDNVLLGEWIKNAIDYSFGWILFCTNWKMVNQWIELGKQIGDLTNMIIWDKGGGGIGDLQHSLSTDYEIILAYNRGNKIIGKRIGSVWNIGKDNPNIYEHPTQKPIELSSLAIRILSIGSILDLFLGSGSTLIACEQLNRICYGMEIDPVYCDVIINRWEQYTKKKAVKVNG